MTTLLSSDRDHAIDRLAAVGADTLEVLAVEDFTPGLIALSTTFQWVASASTVGWVGDRLTLRWPGRCVQFPEVTEHG